MYKTEMFMEMVLRMTRIRSKTVQKIGIASYIIRSHNALVHKIVSLGLDTLTLTTKWNDFN